MLSEGELLFGSFFLYIEDVHCLGDNSTLFQIGTCQKRTTLKKTRKRFLRIDDPNKVCSVKTRYLELQLR